MALRGLWGEGLHGARWFGNRYDSRVVDAVTYIEQLRKHRQRPERDLSIAQLVGAMADDARRTERRLGALIDLWSQLVPGELEKHSRVVAVRGGVVQIQCDSASTKYELDRLLRQGLEQELRTRHSSTLTKIKLSIGDVELRG